MSINPVPKNVNSVPPLEGVRFGLKDVVVIGAKSIAASSLATINENFLYSVD